MPVGRNQNVTTYVGNTRLECRQTWEYAEIMWSISPLFIIYVSLPIAYIILVRLLSATYKYRSGMCFPSVARIEMIPTSFLVGNLPSNPFPPQSMLCPFPVFPLTSERRGCPRIFKGGFHDVT